jgi:hypothetical protein
MANKQRCEYIKADGTRCKAYARHGSDFCLWHDPKLQPVRRLWSSKGGRRTQERSGATRGDLKEKQVSEKGLSWWGRIWGRQQDYSYKKADEEDYILYQRRRPDAYEEIEKWKKWGYCPSPYGYTGTWPPQNDGERRIAIECAQAALEAGPLSWDIDDEFDAVYIRDYGWISADEYKRRRRRLGRRWYE